MVLDNIKREEMDTDWIWEVTLIEISRGLKVGVCGKATETNRVKAILTRGIKDEGGPMMADSMDGNLHSGRKRDLKQLEKLAGRPSPPRLVYCPPPTTRVSVKRLNSHQPLLPPEISSFNRPPLLHSKERIFQELIGFPFRVALQKYTRDIEEQYESSNY